MQDFRYIRCAIGIAKSSTLIAKKTNISTANGVNTDLG